ncbi:hypothetical protein [Salinispora oceanensis]|uniref:hypothetical protein n=1 Tax=Salinispora oceanensis TaxID=1050199 RepID=UPI001CC402F6|nr:hypothetical protein [Salinispora oceanensis]
MNLTRVVGLAGQLALGSPRLRLRFIFTAAGMAVAALFLLAGAAVLPLSEAQRDRAADRSPTLEKGEHRSAGTLLNRGVERCLPGLADTGGRGGRDPAGCAATTRAGTPAGSG